MKPVHYVLGALVGALLVFILTRFGHFHDTGDSLYIQMGWLRFVPFGYLFGIFLVRVILEVKEGGWSGWVWKGNVPAYVTDNEKVRWYQASYTILCAGCLIGEIAILILSLVDR